jgi:hypothetical protein
LKAARAGRGLEDQAVDLLVVFIVGVGHHDVESALREAREICQLRPDAEGTWALSARSRMDSFNQNGTLRCRAWISRRLRAYCCPMRGRRLCIAVLGMSCSWLAAGVSGCGGSCPEAETASSTAASSAESPAKSDGLGGEESAPAPAAEEAASSSAPAPTEKGPSSSSSASGESASDVQFPEGASVAQAVAAVPRGTQRANIDEETLAQPLQSEALWAPCKVGAQHFKVKIAVWNGHAVGVDVTSSSKPLAACVEKQVRGVEWRDKVKSLNSVEYSM